MKFTFNLLWVSLICSIVGLLLTYIAALNVEPREVELRDVNFEMIGKFVETEGEIVYKKTHPSGHLFLTIEDEGVKLQVPLFANVMNDLKSKGLDEDDFEKGKVIRIRGLVSEYREQLQVIPRNGDDVEMVSR